MEPGRASLDRLEETLAGVARDASIGQQVHIRRARLDQGQPHLRAAFHAWHLNAGLKARTGRRRPERWQHRILTLDWGTQHDATNQLRISMCDFDHNWNRGWGDGTSAP